MLAVRATGGAGGHRVNQLTASAPPPRRPRRRPVARKAAKNRKSRQRRRQRRLIELQWQDDDEPEGPHACICLRMM